MAPISDFGTVLVPLKLDAFVLNPAVAGKAGEEVNSRISPITQPNYTFLRLDNFLLQSDVLDHSDLHSTAPSTVNSRLNDLGERPPKPLRHRHGVYVHWTLPRFYRASLPTPGTETEKGAPEPVEPPTRWLVIRKIDVDTVKPETAKDYFKANEYEAWVIESDFAWSLDQIPLDLDLQTDMAPFVRGQTGSDINIEQQAEIFIGRRWALKDWPKRGDETFPPGDRPPSISLLRSSNQLFADFQMHNSNVFSMVDNFRYGPKNKPSYLTAAKASYYIMGWHWDQGLDPLYKVSKGMAHGASLESLFMSLQGVDKGPDNRDPWLDASGPLRLLCHGAMYDVLWDHENKPATVPADEFGKRLKDPVLPAISVGVTPMDALVSLCTSRQDKNNPASIPRLEESILALYSLLHSRDDGVEGQREAKDAIYNWAFERSPGGTRYNFSGPEDGDTHQPTKPSLEAVAKLRELNQTRALWDACNATMEQYRWDMFSLWWKYVSDVANKENREQNERFKDNTTQLANTIKALQKRLNELETAEKNLLKPPREGPHLLANAKKGASPFFYQSHDPTVLVAGIESGWPTDYLDKLSVRAPVQTIPAESLPNGLTTITDLFSKLPPVFADIAKTLAGEFFSLRPGGGDSGTSPAGRFYPQFHDADPKDAKYKRDEWGNKQPWFPLFAEWEVEYTHVPWEYWKLDELSARNSSSKLVRYGVSVPPLKPSPPGAPPAQERALWEKDVLPKKPDTRILSGRVLILPQPAFSLEAKIRQLFSNTPPQILDGALSEKDREWVLENIRTLSYLSAPLAGLSDGLVTKAQGSHIKPENKTIVNKVEDLSPIQAAVFPNAGLTEQNIRLISGNSALTPYAAMTNFINTGFCPFKPVTHGQIRFRKFNIIDKFGQALAAIDPEPRADGPPPYHPCISDYYEPQTITRGNELYANTVIQNRAKQCQFVQLPPQINQKARLNACFVKWAADDGPPPAPPPDGGKVKPRPNAWRPVSEWENPIWGWIITNYADYGLQIFLPDGTFYREVRIGGPLGALTEPAWIPFAPDEKALASPETAQLDALVNKLKDPAYLLGFWRMITTAQDNLPPAPSAYAQFLNSIVGKPLALANMGWSLELDSPPLRNQSTNSPVALPERVLTEVGSSQKRPAYRFQVRLGDRDREYDGLVGYFDTVASAGPDKDRLDLDHINTFFAPAAGETPMTPLRRLDTSTYPIFTPFWEDPTGAGSATASPDEFDARRNARLKVYGAVLDPFTAAHGYSSFLPAVALQLPPWTWQEAMNTMTAFFHAGPLILPLGDVEPYDAAQRLTGANARNRPARTLVSLPALGAGEWSWLQPYVDPGDDQDQSKPPVFNAFGVEKAGDPRKPGFEHGPYTAIEGFLQLRNPIMMPVEEQA